MKGIGYIHAGKGMLVIFGFLWLGLLSLFVFGGTSYASQTAPMADGSQNDSELADSWDFSEIEDFMEQQTSLSTLELSFGDMVKLLLQGKVGQCFTMVSDAVAELLFSEIKANGSVIGQVLIIGIIGAVFSNFASIFSGSQISEAGFYITYLLLFSLLAAGFLASVSIAAQVLNQTVGFMQALMPAYCMAIAFSGHTTASVAVYEFTLFLVSLVQVFLLKLLLPLTRVYVFLVLAGHISKEDILSRMTELVAKAVSWGLKTCIGIVLGFHMIQNLIIPYKDSIQTGALQKVLQIIPGIGQGASALTQVVLGSGVLIKNTIGAAAVIIVIFMVVIPIGKLLIITVFYYLAAALLQPICDKRMISCIQGVAEGHKMLLSLVMTTVFLFIVTIALVCTSTNASYFAG